MLVRKIFLYNPIKLNYNDAFYYYKYNFFLIKNLYKCKIYENIFAVSYYFMCHSLFTLRFIPHVVLEKIFRHDSKTWIAAWKSLFLSQPYAYCQTIIRFKPLYFTSVNFASCRVLTVELKIKSTFSSDTARLQCF